jgi:glutamate-ammonia-ligase adenylyltransferase
MLHIGVRDLLRLSSVDETLAALSMLAEILIAGACRICLREMRCRYGITGGRFRRFSIVALGKLGGGELNFSSDVDLIYVYGSDEGAVPVPDNDGQSVDAQGYFSELARRVTSALNALSGEGYVYRVDLRLRPEGDSGNIADSLTTYRRYYEVRAATWERLALLKAWPVAGDTRLGRNFLAMAQGIVFARQFNQKTRDDISAMKRRIDQQMSVRRQSVRNVKLGTGGIREIELIVQSLQICHGGLIPSIRDRRTVNALRSLQRESIISAQELDTLAGAYIFLRDVENKLQMVYDAQTHSLPETDEELTACARRLGFRDKAGITARDQFIDQYRRHTTAVNRLFEDFFGPEGMRRFQINP